MVDPYEAELAEQAASGGSGSTLGGGFNFSSSSSSSDDGDDYVAGQGISLTKAQRQDYVPGQGFTFSMPSASDRARQQRLSQIGGGDYQNSPQYQKFMEATGATPQNPYGNNSLFAGIFGAENINYNLDPKQSQDLMDIAFDRYMNFEAQPEYAQRTKFGGFGSPTGEVTSQGEVRQQITPMSTGEMAGRALSSLGGLGLFTAMVPGGNVGYAPTGAPGYDPRLDPTENPALRTGMLSGVADFLTGGAGTAIAERTGQGITTLTDQVRDFFTPDNEQVIQGQMK